MSKKKRHIRSGTSPSMSVPIHGISVRLPHELGLRPEGREIEISMITERIIKSVGNRARKAGFEQRPASQGADDQWQKTAAAVATNAWRAKMKMIDPNTGEAREEMKRVYRHIEAIFDALKQAGVETIDPTGKAYNSGMALKVVSVEKTLGISKEQIKETVRPSVTLQGRLIQMGEVIVGTPETDSSNAEGYHEQDNH